MNPRKRDEGMLVKPIGEETVLYDIERLRAHSLEPLAARIWAASDGQRSVEAIAAHVSAEMGRSVQPEVVTLILRRLERAGLMETREPRPFALSCSRRTLMTRVAALGGLAVFSTVLPTPAQAATLKPPGDPCTSSAECASGCCCSFSPVPFCTFAIDTCIFVDGFFCLP